MAFRDVQSFHRIHDVGQFAHAGRLDKYPFGMELLHHLAESVAEVSHKAAADASRVHLVYDHSRILQEAAVHADLTEFVLDEYYLLSLIGFFDELLDKCCLSGS